MKPGGIDPVGRERDLHAQFTGAAFLGDHGGVTAGASHNPGRNWTGRLSRKARCDGPGSSSREGLDVSGRRLSRYLRNQV